jgi:hypothetical protein
VTRAGAAGMKRRLADAGVPWLPLERLLQSWSDGQSHLSLWVPAIWLEFDDLRTNVPRQTAPSLSICLVPAYDSGGPVGPAGGELETARQAMSVMGAPQATTDLMAGCFDRLPPGARFIHLSVMFGRPSRAVKLYGAFPREALLPYLGSIGWRGDQGSVRTALGGVYARDLVGDQIFVDLDLDTFRDPGRCTLGLATGQQHVASGPHHDPGRAQVLEAWVQAGLCQPEKARALAGWAQPPARFLDLKLVWRSGLGWRAKAYLGQRRRGGLFFADEDPGFSQQRRLPGAEGEAAHHLG